MAVKEILLFGNPLLYQKCKNVLKDEINSVKIAITDLHDTMMDFCSKYKHGRATYKNSFA